MRVAGLALTLVVASHAQLPRQPVDYVNPNIGGIGILLTATAPLVQYPHGMMRVAPETTPGITDRFLADKIYAFPAGPLLLMPVTRAAAADPAAYASSFDHDQETATPFYYQVLLEDSGIDAEVTTTQKAAIYRFQYPRNAPERLLMHLEKDADLTVVSSAAIEGSERAGDSAAIGAKPGARQYFYAEFSAPFSSWHPLTRQNSPGDSASRPATQTGDNPGIVAEIASPADRSLAIRIGISYISAEQARKNLEEEIPDWSFDTVKAKARVVWNDALSRIAVTGGTDRQRTIFYTALYRALSRMTDITEDGRYYSGFDGKVHATDGRDFYVDDGLWDTWRGMHPLQLLLDPRRQEDMVESYVRMYEQSGWLPSFPQVNGEMPFMIGHHAAALIADTYSKGYRDFDVQEAYAGIRKDILQETMLPWRRGPLTPPGKIYFEKGFFPALARGEKETEPEVHPFERRQAVSVTLENAYDAWCAAQMAKALGKTADYELFMKLAHNYRNVFDPKIGFMAPRSADGEWVADFDPKLGGGQGARDYFTEVDSWIYTFSVPHDPAGLIQLMGGKDSFNARLDQLFQEQYGTAKYEFLAQFPDATGLVGLYAQGNEPSFHIPYLYDFSGQPWKTQRRVRQLMDIWYGDGPRGIPGDDDGGATSSWYVLSAMGFYPVCPGSPVYEIGSPIFAKTTITLGNGRAFTITAVHVSAKNKYIQSATLNGRDLNRPWFSHSDIAQGGSLVLIMGPLPNMQWGSAPSDAPPSMSAPERGN